jgi:hypothetical protein
MHKVAFRHNKCLMFTEQGEVESHAQTMLTRTTKTTRAGFSAHTYAQKASLYAPYEKVETFPAFWQGHQ